MFRSLPIWTLAALLLIPVVTWGQAPDEVGPFMRAKLEHAKKVLEGLALEDFDMIAKSSQEMALISQAATWQVLQTPQYAAYSAEFRRTANGLRDAAKKRNLEAATLAYVDMTMKCVQCHKYVRDVKAADTGDALRPLLDEKQLLDVTR